MEFGLSELDLETGPCGCSHHHRDNMGHKAVTLYHKAGMQVLQTLVEILAPTEPQLSLFPGHVEGDYGQGTRLAESLNQELHA